jgi:hypothetical protein
MQSTPSDNFLHPTPEAKHAPLWQIACWIMAIVFGPAFIACILSLLR